MPFDYDVVVLGSGFGGSLTALLCRRIGLRVLLVERDDHPRFAIGESTTPDTNLRLSHLARRFDLPQLHQLTSYCRIREADLPVAAWPKASFYFVHHREGVAVDPDRVRESLFQTSPWPTGPDAHWYRPDLDLFLKNEAVAAGAQYLPYTSPCAFSFSPADGVTISLNSTAKGKGAIRTRLVVDASGASSWLASHLSLRRNPEPMGGLVSSSVFAHFRNVRSWDQMFGERSAPFSRDHATVHHYCAEGWFWIIPFDNGITSVGWVPHGILEPDVDAERVFWEAVRRYPSIRKTLEGAINVTEYFKVARLQYDVKRNCGNGFFILPFAAGFIDPLFSAGMSLTVAAICRLMSVVESAPPNEALLFTDLAHLDRTRTVECEYLTKLVRLVRRCFTDPEAFERAFLIYRLAVLLSGLELARGDKEAMEAPVWGMGEPALRELIDEVLEAALACGKDDVKLTGALDRVIIKYDIYGFHRTLAGRIRTDGLYLSTVWRTADFVLRASKRPREASRFRLLTDLGRRWAGNLSFVPRALWGGGPLGFDRGDWPHLADLSGTVSNEFADPALR